MRFIVRRLLTSVGIIVATASTPLYALTATEKVVISFSLGLCGRIEGKVNKSDSIAFFANQAIVVDGLTRDQVINIMTPREEFMDLVKHYIDSKGGCPGVLGP